MSLLSIALDQVTRREPAYLANATDAARLTIEPIVSSLYTPVSIPEISERIGLSNTAVRRHVKAMLKDGDVIDMGDYVEKGMFGVKKVKKYRIKDAR